MTILPAGFTPLSEAATHFICNTAGLRHEGDVVIGHRMVDEDNSQANYAVLLLTRLRRIEFTSYFHGYSRITESSRDGAYRATVSLYGPDRGCDRTIPADITPPFIPMLNDMPPKQLHQMADLVWRTIRNETAEGQTLAKVTTPSSPFDFANLLANVPVETQLPPHIIRLITEADDKAKFYGPITAAYLETDEMLNLRLNARNFRVVLQQFYSGKTILHGVSVATGNEHVTIVEPDGNFQWLANGRSRLHELKPQDRQVMKTRTAHFAQQAIAAVIRHQAETRRPPHRPTAAGPSAPPRDPS